MEIAKIKKDLGEEHRISEMNLETTRRNLQSNIMDLTERLQTQEAVNLRWKR